MKEKSKTKGGREKEVTRIHFFIFFSTGSVGQTHTGASPKAARHAVPWANLPFAQ